MQGNYKLEAKLRVRINELQTFEAKLRDSQEALKRIKQLFGKGAALAPADHGKKESSGAEGR